MMTSPVHPGKMLRQRHVICNKQNRTGIAGKPRGDSQASIPLCQFDVENSGIRNGDVDAPVGQFCRLADDHGIASTRFQDRCEVKRDDAFIFEDQDSERGHGISFLPVLVQKR